MEKVGVGTAYPPPPPGFGNMLKQPKVTVGQRDYLCPTATSLGAGHPVIILGITYTRPVLSTVLACHLLVGWPGVFTSQIKKSHVGNSLAVQWLGLVLSLQGPRFDPWSGN